MNWIHIDSKPPKKHGVFWVYPTEYSRRYCALYWDGVKFFSGEYEPKGLTHYHEMSLHYPEPPESKVFREKEGEFEGISEDANI